MAVFGLGLGMNMQSIVLAMQNAVEPRDMGVATSAVDVLPPGRRLARHRDLPVDPVLQRRHQHRQPVQRGEGNGVPAAAKAHPAKLQFSITGGSGLNDTAFLQKLDHALAHPFLVGFSDAMDTRVPRRGVRAGPRRGAVAACSRRSRCARCRASRPAPRPSGARCAGTAARAPPAAAPTPAADPVAVERHDTADAGGAGGRA